MKTRARRAIFKWDDARTLSLPVLRSAEVVPSKASANTVVTDTATVKTVTVKTATVDNE